MSQEIKMTQEQQELAKSISLINMSVQVIPQYEENFNRMGFIEFGYDNLFPQKLIKLMAESALNNAIICGKAQMVGGNGWVKKDLSPDALLFLKNVYSKYDLDELLARISYDKELYGAFALNIIWSKDRTKISQIDYVDPSKLRIAVPDNKYPDLDRYWLCDNWDDMRKHDPILYPGFSVSDRKKASQILYVKDYHPGSEYYGIPEYYSGINWINLEWEISQFHLSNIQRGFTPNYMINFISGNPSDEQKRVLKRQAENELKGATRGGNNIITFTDKDSVPIFTAMQTNDNDTKFIELCENMRQGIINAHRINDPAIFGINNDKGVIVSQSRNLNSIEEFQASYITPRQNSIEKVFNRLLRINNIYDNLKIEEYKIKYSKMDLSVSDVLSILQSPIGREQKIALLSSSGYTNEEAEKLVGTDVQTPPTQNNPI